MAQGSGGVTARGRRSRRVPGGPLKVALIGTRGVPANYGGFETAVEEVGRRLVERGHEVLVFCRSGTSQGSSHPTEYLGMKLVTLPALRKRSLETLSHTLLSVLHGPLGDTDAAIVFNAANSPLIPVLRARGIPCATHVDGLEWKRAKWGTVGRQYYRNAESIAVRLSDALIADAHGIADYYRTEFGAPTRLIAYGAPVNEHPVGNRLHEVGAAPGRYHLAVARFEPENQVLEVVSGYSHSGSRLPLMVVGSAPYSARYTREVRNNADARVRFLGGVWDQELLDQLYGNASSYLHGHSVGGTNPSLLRAAGAGASVIAYDVPFNREVVGRNGLYFRTRDDVSWALATVESDPEAARARGNALRDDIVRYSWDGVADEYEQLLRDLAESGPTPLSSHPSGLRRRSASPAGVGR